MQNPPLLTPYKTPGVITTPIMQPAFGFMPQQPGLVAPQPALTPIRPNNPAPNLTFPTAQYSWAPNDMLKYSDFPPMLVSGQVQQVAILLDPHSYTAIPTAQITLKNGNIRKMLLPRETEAFTTMLDNARVPYQFQSNAPTGSKKILHTIKETGKELFVPFMMLAAAAGSSAYLMKRLEQKRKEGAIKEAIQQAHKDVNEYKREYDQTLQDYEPQVRNELNAFLQNERNVIIAKGLPGIGKTYIFQVLAKEVKKRNDDVMVLEIRKNSGDNIRDFLNQMYSGDRLIAKQAIKLLTAENGGKPVKELLLYADEIEKIPQDLMEFLINNGIGNPDTAIPGLPRLRILGTCNGDPDFMNNSATRSRVSSITVNPPSIATVSKIFGEALQKELPDQIQREKLQNQLEKVFTEYDGYSPRTLTTSVVKEVANQLKEQNQFDDESVVKTLKQTLARTPLTATEVAALMTHIIVERVMNGQQPLDEHNGKNNLWQLTLNHAEELTKGIHNNLEANGKQYKENINRLLNQQSLDYEKDPEAIKGAIDQVSTSLKAERLQVLRNITPALSAQKELTDHYRDFLERTLEKAQQLPQKDQQANRIKTLKAGIQGLRHIDRRTEAGKHLAKAAQFYQELKSVEDPQDAVFLDTDKLDAVFRRTLDYDPGKHTKENDYMLVSEPAYAAMFMHLRLALSNMIKSAA